MNRAYSILVIVAALSPSAWSQAALTLDEAIAIAQKSSPVLRAVLADLAAARAAEQGAKSMTGFQVSANGFATTGNNVSIFGSPPRTDPAVAMQVPQGNFFAGNLMAMMPIFAGQVTGMAEASSWETRAAIGELQEAKAALKLRVTEAFYKAQFGLETIRLAEARLGATTELLRTTTARLETGATIQASVDRVKAEVLRSERELTMARTEQLKATLELKQVMGVPLETSLEMVAPVAYPQSDSTVVDLLGVASKARGVIQAARARASAFDAELRAARSQSLPALYATGMADVTNRRDMGGLSVGLAISLPIFDSGRIRSEVARARSLKEKAAANLSEATLMVELEVRQAYLDFEVAKSNLTSFEAALSAAESAYEVVRLRVDAGKAILLELLDSLQMLTEARSDLVRARLDVALTLARLDRASGGLR